MALLADQGNVDFIPVAAAVGGDLMVQGTRAGGWAIDRVLYVNNAGAVPITVTAGEVEHSVPVGLSLIPVHGIYKDGLKSITYSAVTSVTVASVRLF